MHEASGPPFHFLTCERNRRDAAQIWYNGAYRNLSIRKGATTLKVSNLLQLTEHHRYAVVRRFGLSALDLKMLWTVYQPMAGGFAISLYTALYAALSAEAVGVSEPAPLKQLFLAVGLEPNEKGRKRLVDETSKLEALGLLQTFRKQVMDDMIEYEFRLVPPLAPDQFFGVHHLWLLLQERLGASAAESLRRSFVKEVLEDDEHAEIVNISTPFYELYRVSLSAAGSEGAEASAAPPAPTEVESPGQFGRDGFRPDEVLHRFPRSSPNRRAVERLVADAAKFAELNYIAGRCGLTLKQTVSLLDEDGLFDTGGVWRADRFQSRSMDIYRQSNMQDRQKERTVRQQEIARSAEASEAGAESGVRHREERDIPEPYWLPVPEQFQGQCDVRQYNALLANLPYPKVLKMFFAPSAVPTAVEEAFMAMNIHYQLPDEVINVMIHYIRTNDLDWKRNYLDAIGANVAGKRIRTFENAVVYFRKEEQTRSKTANGRPDQRKAAGAGGRTAEGRRGRASSAKPVIPVVRSEGKSEATEEDIKRIMEMAERLKNG